MPISYWLRFQVALFPSVPQPISFPRKQRRLLGSGSFSLVAAIHFGVWCGCCCSFEVVKHFHINKLNRTVLKAICFYSFLNNTPVICAVTGSPGQCKLGRNNPDWSFWIKLTNSQFKTLATLSQMGTWEINFILPSRIKRGFLFICLFIFLIWEVFKCNYTAGNPLFVKDETITSL